MKTLFLFLLYFLLLPATIFQQGDGFMDVNFSDKNTGTAVGGSTIIRTTDGGNNWFRQINNITNIKRDKNISPTTFELLQNYPDPFNPTTKIVYSISKRSNVLIKSI